MGGAGTVLPATSHRKRNVEAHEAEAEALRVLNQELQKELQKEKKENQRLKKRVQTLEINYKEAFNNFEGKNLDTTSFLRSQKGTEGGSVGFGRGVPKVEDYYAKNWKEALPSSQKISFQKLNEGEHFFSKSLGNLLLGSSLKASVAPCTLNEGDFSDYIEQLEAELKRDLSSNNNQLMTLSEQNRGGFEKERIQFGNTIEQLRTQLKKTQEALIDNAKQYEEERADLIETYNNQLQKAEEEKEETVNLLIEDFENQKKRLKEHHEDELKLAIENKEEEFALEKSNLEAVLKANQDQVLKDKEKIYQRNLKQKEKALALHYAREIKELHDQRDQLVLAHKKALRETKDKAEKDLRLNTKQLTQRFDEEKKTFKDDFERKANVYTQKINELKQSAMDKDKEIIDLGIQQAALKKTHALELEILKKEKEKTLAFLKTAHAQEKSNLEAALKADQERALEKKQEKYQQTLKQKEEDLKVQHAHEIKSLKDAQSKELNKQRDQLVLAHNKTLQETKDNAENNLLLKTTALTQQFEQEKKELKLKHLLAIQQKGAELEALETFSKEEQNRFANLQGQHILDLKKHEEGKNQLERDYKKALKKADQDKQSALDLLAKEFNKQKIQLELRHQQTLKEAEKEREEALSVVKAAYVNELNLRLAAQKEKFEKKNGLAKRKLEQTSMSYEDQLAQVKMAIQKQDEQYTHHQEEVMIREEKMRKSLSNIEVLFNKAALLESEEKEKIGEERAKVEIFRSPPRHRRNQLSLRDELRAIGQEDALDNVILKSDYHSDIEAYDPDNEIKSYESSPTRRITKKPFSPLALMRQKKDRDEEYEEKLITSQEFAVKESQQKLLDVYRENGLFDFEFSKKMFPDEGPEVDSIVERNRFDSSKDLIIAFYKNEAEKNEKKYQEENRKLTEINFNLKQKIQEILGHQDILKRKYEKEKETYEREIFLPRGEEREKIDLLTGENKSLSRKIKEYHKNIEVYEEKVKKKRARYQSLRETYNLISKEKAFLEEKTRDYAHLKADLEEAEGLATQFHAATQKLERENRELTYQNEELRVTLAVSKDGEELREENEKLNKDIEYLSQRIGILNQQLIEAKEDNDKVKGKYKIAKKKLNEEREFNFNLFLKKPVVTGSPSKNDNVGNRQLIGERTNVPQKARHKEDDLLKTITNVNRNLAKAKAKDLAEDKMAGRLPQVSSHISRSSKKNKENREFY